MPDQSDLIKFVQDPKTIKQAVEGSMDKRNNKMTDPKQQLVERICKIIDDAGPDADHIEALASAWLEDVEKAEREALRWHIAYLNSEIRRRRIYLGASNDPEIPKLIKRKRKLRERLVALTNKPKESV